MCQSETQHLPFEQNPFTEMFNVSFLLHPSSSKHLLSKVEMEKQTLITLYFEWKRGSLWSGTQALYWHDSRHPQTARKTAPQIWKPFPGAQQLDCTANLGWARSTFTSSGTSSSVSWLEVLVQVWMWNGTIPVILNDEIPSIWQRSLEHMFSLHFPKTDITLPLPII